jgi:hypothetical protein
MPTPPFQRVSGSASANRRFGLCGIPTTVPKMSECSTYAADSSPLALNHPLAKPLYAEANVPLPPFVSLAANRKG